MSNGGYRFIASNQLPPNNIVTQNLEHNIWLLLVVCQFRKKQRLSNNVNTVSIHLHDVKYPELVQFNISLQVWRLVYKC